MNISSKTSTHGLHWKLDAAEGHGVRLSAQSRIAMMQRLSRDEDTKGTGPGVPEVSPVTNAPSTCIVMQNMFDPAEESTENWHVDVKQDVVGRVSMYGAVQHSYLEKELPGGLIYIKLGNVESAQRAIADLNGRFFGGRKISVRFVSEDEYKDKADPRPH